MNRNNFKIMAVLVAMVRVNLHKLILLLQILMNARAAMDVTTPVKIRKGATPAAAGQDTP